MPSAERISGRVTYQEFLRTPLYKTHELVRGVPRSLPGGARSAFIAGQIAYALQAFNRSTHVGYVLARSACRYDPGDPDHYRRPDVLYLSRRRLPGGRVPVEDLTIAPDLAAEVVAPTELAVELELKVDEYLQFGVKLVWIVVPETRTVRVHRADGTVSVLHERDAVSGENVLEGFTCPVADFFPPGT